MYTNSQLEKIIDNILTNLAQDENYEVGMAREEIDDLLKMINSRKRSEHNLKQFIAAYIYNHGIYMEAGSHAMEYNLIRKIALKRYAHNLNLKYIKNEIYYKYDIKSGKMIMFRWHNKDGVCMDSLVEELKDFGIFIESEIESEIFNEFLDCLVKYKPTFVREVIEKAIVQNVVDSTFDKLKNKVDNVENNFAEYNNVIDPIFENTDDELFD